MDKTFITKKADDKAYWSAVFSLFLGVTSLIAAEFLPVSLLTPIAVDLNISEGMAGQSVTAVGIFAVITSLVLAPLTQKIDRRLVLLAFSILLIVSNLIVSMAQSYHIMLIGRSILGICVGGFWSMASAVALRLVPASSVPRALSIIYAGVSVATIISIPVASYVGQFIGWRDVFLLACLLGFVALIMQWLTLPKMPPKEGSNFGDMAALLSTKWVFVGLSSMVFSYGGYHVFFTYLRPFLEKYLLLQANHLALVLLGFGLANCFGTFVSGMVLSRSFRKTIILVHLVLALVAVLLYFGQNIVWQDTIFVMVWGFIFGIIPVAWSTWVVRTLADKAEIAGGLMVAAIQFSIGVGAATGGVVFDNSGIKGVFLTSFIFMLISIAAATLSFSLYYKKTGRHA